MARWSVLRLNPSTETHPALNSVPKESHCENAGAFLAVHWVLLYYSFRVLLQSLQLLITFLANCFRSDLGRTSGSGSNLSSDLSAVA